VDLRISQGPPGANTIVSASPRYLSNPAPDYPLPCKRRHEEGIVLLNVIVQPDGLPAAISLDRGSGYPLLDRAALDAVRHWTFEPARAAGVPVSSLIVVPVRFSLDQP
jgi:protein TonB